MFYQALKEIELGITRVVEVGGLVTSNTPGETVKTFGLGSCVAVVFLCPATRTVGMVHVALPHSSICPDKVKTMPGYFADTGIPALLQKMAAMGSGNKKAMMVKLAGGANVMDPNNTFDIGKRNILAIKKTLWALGMEPMAEDVGGSISRTVTVSIDTGMVILSSPGCGEWRL